MKKMEDLTGRVFGRLTVLEFVEKRNFQYYWKCFCNCGNIHTSNADTLRKGQAKSCGCLKQELHFKRIFKHGQCIGNKYSAEYVVYAGILNRCYNKNSQSYSYYGGRGIKISNEWKENFLVFLSDMGKRPKNHSLDRIDVNGDYCKENCRWADSKTQSNNKRTSKYFTYLGERKTLSEIAQATGLCRTTLAKRIDKLGKTIDEAIAMQKNMDIPFGASEFDLLLSF